MFGDTGGEGGEQVSDEMEECIGRILMMVREDRQKQSLSQGG